MSVFGDMQYQLDGMSTVTFDIYIFTLCRSAALIQQLRCGSIEKEGITLY